MEKDRLEKYSSAFTLSDMEIFIFPELLYSQLLANIMSPEIWKWKDDPWFTGIGKMTPVKKIHRLKQFIMDHYNFNLDLDTWGLTDKETEINRFKDFIDPVVLSRSNALFGYEGDKYYFDIDIRRHFGLDKYNSDVIPYWKTETVEAMNAFRFKPGYETGAGECVSLACLYAAALFIVAEVPLEKIFLMGTPLHSQNFILIDEGILTNNRRIVTKPMWYNGTELSSLARRALENEQITIVAHASGYIHSVYPEATINRETYQFFAEAISRYLVTGMNFEIFINFLRDYSKHQKLFQIGFPCHDTLHYIRLEKAFGYEHGSKNRISDKTGRKLLCEMDEEDLCNHPLAGRTILDPADELFREKPLEDFIPDLKSRFPDLTNYPAFFTDLEKFACTVPRLPAMAEHKFHPSGEAPITLMPQQSREEIIEYLTSIRDRSVVADLAFYAGRQMDSCDWEPLMKAALERNPVSINWFSSVEIAQVAEELHRWPDESIYSGNRLALPDEVVNYKRGDGIEKAITLLNILKSRGIKARLMQQGKRITVEEGDARFEFYSGKEITADLNQAFV